MENNQNFSYTYSSAQKQEVESIRKKYLPKEEDKMDQLRRLHQIPARKARTASLVVGIMGALILGTGMSMFMTELSTVLGELAMIIGVAVGVAGMILVALAYPLYNHVLQKQRQRIAAEILRLTDELLK